MRSSLPVMARTGQRISPRRLLTLNELNATICAAALCYDDPEDPGATRLQAMIRREGLQETLRRISGLERGSEFVESVLSRYSDLRSQKRM